MCRIATKIPVNLIVAKIPRNLDVIKTQETTTITEDEMNGRIVTDIETTPGVNAELTQETVADLNLRTNETDAIPKIVGTKR